MTVEVGVFAAAVEAQAPAPRRPFPAGDAPSIILYTSGTSGRPKGVIVTERNAFATAVNFGVLGRVGNASIFLCDAPMFHVIGLITSLRAPLLQGGTVLISPASIPASPTAALPIRRSASPTISACRRWPGCCATIRSSRPAGWTSLTAIFTGGAPNPAADIRWWLQQGVRMVDGYGMTEAGTVLGMPIDAEVIFGKAGSAGLAGAVAVAAHRRR